MCRATPAVSRKTLKLKTDLFEGSSLMVLARALGIPDIKPGNRTTHQLDEVEYFGYQKNHITSATARPYQQPLGVFKSEHFDPVQRSSPRHSPEVSGSYKSHGVSFGKSTPYS